VLKSELTFTVEFYIVTDLFKNEFKMTDTATGNDAGPSRDDPVDANSITVDTIDCVSNNIV
jgi:hypothetical protein